MAKAKNYAYADLSGNRTLYLEIEGAIYEVIQYTASFALNEIPKATVLVAAGRDARSQGAAVKAVIHKTGIQLSQMKRARVYFQPTGEWDTSGKEWPEQEMIFDGYYVGLAYRKSSGKLQAVIHLVHWLIDLSFTSTLSKNMHPSNPTSLVAPAVAEATQGAGAGGQPVYVSHHIGHETIKDKVRTDLWSGIKTMLCELAGLDRFELLCNDTGLGSGDKKKNDRALKALSRIQGPSAKCDLAYDTFGKPLKMQTEGVPLVSEAVADSVTQQTLQSYAHTTFWDTIIGQFCPMFNLAIVPRVDDAIVIADTPALQWKPGGAFSKSVGPDDWDSVDITGMISRPLQAVGVYGDYESLTGWETTEVGKSGNVCIGGHYAVDAEEASDGMFLIVKSPPWLRTVCHTGVYAGNSTGIKLREKVSPTTVETPGEIIPGLRKLYNRYAKTVYVANMLRGRSASITGKMRFDIAPGCVIQILPKPELFLEGVDELATTIYAHVTRVTININAEASLCGTSFQCTHVRTEHENTLDRTMVTEHPLFGTDIFKGAPLINNWGFLS